MALDLDDLASLTKANWGLQSSTQLWGYSGTRDITLDFDRAASKNAAYVSRQLQDVSAKFLLAAVILHAQAREPDHWSKLASRPYLLDTIYTTLDRAADMYTLSRAAAKLTDCAKAMAFFDKYIMHDEELVGALRNQYGDELLDRLLTRWTAIRGYWPVVW
jgi:hypothetical protein